MGFTLTSAEDEVNLPDEGMLRVRLVEVLAPLVGARKDRFDNTVKLAGELVQGESNI